MNNPWSAFATLLQALPPSIRRTLYSLVTAAGAVLALAQFFGWDLGIDMEKALAFYAVVSSPTGALALANVKPKDGDYAGFDPDADYRDYDLASFEGSDGFDAWEETAVQDVDDDGSVDLSTEPSEESAEEPSFS
jgi:hypothetical protein